MKARHAITRHAERERAIAVRKLGVEGNFCVDRLFEQAVYKFSESLEIKRSY